MKIKCQHCGKTFRSYKAYFDLETHPCEDLLTKEILERLWKTYRSPTKIAKISGYSIGRVSVLLRRYGIAPTKENKWKLFKVKVNKYGYNYPQVVSIPFIVIQKALGKEDIPKILVYRTYVEEEGSNKIIVELSEDLSKYTGRKKIRVTN